MALTLIAMKHFGKILTLRGEPSDLPHSVPLLVSLLPIYFLCYLIQYLPSFIVLMAQHSKVDEFFWLVPGILPIYLFTTGLSLFLMYQILKYEDKANRFVQIACNYLGLVCAYIMVKGFLDFFENGVLYTLFFLVWFYIVLVQLLESSFERTKIEAFGLMLIIHLGPLVLIPFYIKFLISIAVNWL